MWHRSDSEEAHKSNKTGSSSDGSQAGVPGHDPAWHSIPPGLGNIICNGRRHSTVSDSGDTGIGTFCSNSVEDDSSTSTSPFSFQSPAQHYLGQGDDVNPMIHVMSSPSSSSYTSFGIPASPSSTSWSCQLLTATSLEGAPSCQDMKYNQPMRKCSSLTNLPSGSDESSKRTSCYQYSQGSLDRGLLYGHRKKPIGSNVDLYLPLSSSLLCNSLLECSPGAGPCNRYNHSS